MNYKRIEVKSGDYTLHAGATGAGDVTVARGGAQRGEKTSISVTSGGQSIESSKLEAVNRQLRGEQSRGGAVTSIGRIGDSKR